jgi:hypothetical protein
MTVNETSSAQHPDFTKSKSYAVLELFVKAVSAVAIVALGIAGWRLQQRDQETRYKEEVRQHQIDDREREERKYLPTLRSITEVDLILAETSSDYVWPTHSDAEVGQEARLGTHLAYFGGSLYFPDAEPLFDIVTAADNANGVTNPHTVKIAARSAVLMLADLMRLAPFFKRMDHPGTHARIEDGELIFEDRRGKFLDSIALDQRTAEAWSSWLPQGGISLKDLFHEIDLDTLADDIHTQLNRVAEAIVNKDADVLSPQFVKIRDDVLRSRNELLPVPH